MHGILVPCQSPYHTSVLPVVKPSREYRMIQDLKVANDAVIPTHPLLANPFDILSQVPENAQWFTMLDLKDVFFCNPVQPSSQYLLAFERINPDLGKMQQYTQTVLPQGFWDSPRLFTEALGKELREVYIKGGAILQYIDDILTCSPTREASDQSTIEVLNFLKTQDYRVSQRRAQISKQQVKYLGYIINPRNRQLSPDRKLVIPGLSAPKTKKHLCTYGAGQDFAEFGF